MRLVPNAKIYFNVMDYGARADNATNDAAAINAANTAAAAAGGNGGVVYFPPGTYYISSAVTFTTHVEGRQAQINTDQDIVAIQVGDGTNYVEGKTLLLPNVRNTSKTGTGWTGSSVGVKCVNLTNCTVHPGEIRGFVTGLNVTAAGTKGTVYNVFELGACKLYDNKVQLLIKPADADAWCNQNQFFGGRFLFNTDEGTAVAGTRNIMIDYYSDANAHLVNNNTFIGASLEGDVPEYHADILGGWNYLRDCRWEATTPKVNIRSYSASRYSQRNSVQGGYASETITYTEDANSRYNMRPEDVYYSEITVTHAQFLALNATPITIVPAPTSGKTFMVLGMIGRFNYGGVAAYTHAGSISCVYSGSTALTQATVGTGANFHTTAASNTKVGGPVSNVNVRNADALVIWASAANPTGGDASNSFKFGVYYRIVNFALG
jgi:hypothetical protein